MGLLSALFGRSSKNTAHEEYDRVWMTSETRLAEVRCEVQQCAKKGAAAVLLVAHFDDLLSQLQTIAAEDYGVPVRLVRASDLNPSVAAEMDLAAASIDIVCADRHPLFSVDQSLLEFANALTCKCRVLRHMCFEDALIKRFVDPDLMRRLGIRDTESVQSGMISRRILNAQRQIEKLAATNIEAGSADEWFEKNCPQMKPVVN